ncbi:hypothetical protein AURDEDRAFT_148747 [Auricularia subglabra TFB-10046 SS5]|nr:hypothetical protein AURDEDRAFT_148747 [Auricularia subglabra TFB-10046 SS5]
MALPPIVLPTISTRQPTPPTFPTQSSSTPPLITRPTLTTQSSSSTETTTTETETTTTETQSSTTDVETTPPAVPTDAPVDTPLPQIDTTTSDTGFGPSGTPGLNPGNGAQIAPKGFFANKGAVTGTFTVVGVIVAALALAFIMMAVRRRRAKQLDQEVAEAAAIQRGFGVGFADDDDDRRPLGGAAVYARPSMSTAHRVSTHESGYGAPSQYSGYSNGYQVQYGQPVAAPYAAYQNGAYAQPPPPAPVEPDVYAYNPGEGGFAGVGAGAGHAQAPSGNGPTAAHFAGPAQQHPAALQPGMSRYAQAQAAAAAQAPDMRQRTPSPPAPPGPAPAVSGAPSAYAPPAVPVRAASATSMQDYQDYASRMDLKLVNG